MTSTTVDARDRRGEPMIVGTVAQLWRYPVKSMLGETIDDSHVDAVGVRGDRAYAVIDTVTGKVASAKHPHKWARLLQLRATFATEPGPEGPLPPADITFPDGTSARSDAPGVDAALSSFLGRDVTLRTSGVAPQPAYEMVWPNGVDGLAPSGFVSETAVGATPDGEPISDLAVGLAAPGTWFDVSPLHLVTTGTLGALRDSTPGSDVHPERFRPNVVVESSGTGCVENAWVQRVLALGEDCRLRVDLPTMRCVMTTLAHGRRPVDRQVLRAVVATNRRDIPGLGTWACAGVYGAPTTAGRVAVGDAVTLVDASIHPVAAEPAAPTGDGG